MSIVTRTRGTTPLFRHAGTAPASTATRAGAWKLAFAVLAIVVALFVALPAFAQGSPLSAAHNDVNIVSICHLEPPMD